MSTGRAHLRGRRHTTRFSGGRVASRAQLGAAALRGSAPRPRASAARPARPPDPRTVEAWRRSRGPAARRTPRGAGTSWRSCSERWSARADRLLGCVRPRGRPRPGRPSRSSVHPTPAHGDPDGFLTVDDDHVPPCRLPVEHYAAACTPAGRHGRRPSRSRSFPANARHHPLRGRRRTHPVLELMPKTAPASRRRSRTRLHHRHDLPRAGRAARLRGTRRPRGDKQRLLQPAGPRQRPHGVRGHRRGVVPHRRRRGRRHGSTWTRTIATCSISPYFDIRSAATVAAAQMSAPSSAARAPFGAC